MTKTKLLDHRGRPLANVAPNLKTKAFGQFGSIYEAPNAERFRPRWYTNQDSELGASSLTRDLLTRWSRELSAQLPMVFAAQRTLALFAVGNSYQPQYVGKNYEWGKQACSWLSQEFYPNCNKRGPTYDFATTMFVMSMMLDQDGDMLVIYGEEAGQPKIQIIPSHRITSQGSNSAHDVVFPTPNSFNGPQIGPFPNTILSDGVVYDRTGSPLGYNVVNPDNVVNQLLGNQSNLFFKSKDAHLIYDPRFFDRGRGLPSLSSGILQGLSLQEIESYMVEKIKIESMIALIEATPNGEGPESEAQAMVEMLAQDNGVGGIPGSAGYMSSTKGLRVVNSPTIKYVNASGGDVKTLSSNTPANETQAYITRLETHLLQSMGVPHMLIFSPEKISGRMSDGVIKQFNASVNYRQKILDKEANFICSWAVAKAIDKGELPPNDAEKLTDVFAFTHPTPLSLNEGYDRQSDLSDYAGGLKSLTEILSKRNKSIHDFMAEIEKEKTMFFNTANKIATATGTDIKLVINSLRDDLAMEKIPREAGEDTNTEQL